VLDLDDARARAVEKVTVVADDDVSRLVRGEELFEPLDRGHVEVVRRLVQEERVRLREQEAREAQTVLLTARKNLRGRRPRVALEAQALQDGLGARGVLEAALVLELVLEVAVAREHRVEVFRRFCHSVFELVHLVLDALKLAEGRERGLVYGRARLEVNVLFEEAQSESARAHNVAAVSRLLARDKAEQSGLPRAVSPDKPDVLARVDLKRRAAQDLLRAVRLLNIGEAEQHNYISTRLKRASAALLRSGLARFSCDFLRRLTSRR